MSQSIDFQCYSRQEFLSCFSYTFGVIALLQNQSFPKILFLANKIQFSSNMSQCVTPFMFFSMSGKEEKLPFILTRSPLDFTVLMMCFGPLMNLTLQCELLLNFYISVLSKKRILF